MATTTFDRHFSVPKVKEDEFVNEMTSNPSSTLRKGFKSHYSTEKSLRKELRATLSEKR